MSPNAAGDLGRVSADWLPYRLAFRRSWEFAAGSLSERQGRLLRLTAPDGYTGWGDCSPFPEIGISYAAATAYARECACLDLAAQAAGLPLADWLKGGQAASRIPVNAALGAIQNVTQADLVATYSAGFEVLKLKVGLGDPDAELVLLRRIAAILPPGIRLRLDANQAWQGPEASRFLAACAELPVEGVEEPLARPECAALRRLQAGLPFPLALDESFDSISGEFFDSPPVRRLILKPARHGSLLAAARLAHLARAAGVECILTSSLESACGLHAAAHLAAAVAPNQVHGLATAHWFDADTGIPPRVENGYLALSPAAGLGFRASPEYQPAHAG